LPTILSCTPNPLQSSFTGILLFFEDTKKQQNLILSSDILKRFFSTTIFMRVLSLKYLKKSHKFNKTRIFSWKCSKKLQMPASNRNDFISYGKNSICSWKLI
jgi:hypothetical protein